jgi:hypothetical protein
MEGVLGPKIRVWNAVSPILAEIPMKYLQAPDGAKPANRATGIAL